MENQSYHNLVVGGAAAATLASIEISPNLRGRSFIRDTDFSPAELLDLMETSKRLKEIRKLGRPHTYLRGKTLGLLFQHPSTRTRTAFQVGMEQLGGQAVFLGIQDLQLKRGETLQDTARIMSGYLDAIGVRIESQVDLDEFARGASVPVYNGLTSERHPIEALGDVFTLRERFGELKGLTFAYLGDGNNVCHSLMLSMAAVGVNLRVASPAGYQPDPGIVDIAKRLAAASGATIVMTEDPHEAVSGVDAVYTDVHQSMGEDAQLAKLTALAPYRVTRGVMAEAAPHAVFMHCLPMRRGLEVEPEVADGPQSIIFDQAENRLHVHKAILLHTMI
ncbi:MAG: ornithine carbamoyltransferase [Thermomicrobiales bacterium]|nr:ornithine carbamoyltransferase [Thermomicrobiales bacterium]